MRTVHLSRIDLNLLVVFDVLMEVRSVSRAADRLGRTQSAVSHALARLRAQLGDPLLVRTAGTMRPSPFALELVEEVRPILRNIQRVLTPPQPFAPAQSTRTFRVVAPDFWAPAFGRFLAMARGEAPGIVLDWMGPRETVLLDVADDRIDLAVAPSGLKPPDGIDREALGVLSWQCFMRDDHPAAADWGAAAWSRWPHLMVHVGHGMQSPVHAATSSARLERSIGAVVPNFAAVPPILAVTDLLATLPTPVMGDGAAHYDLVARPVPFWVPPLPHSLFWSARRSNDPAVLWLRQQLTPLLRDGLD